jgi:hypothetical protein
VNDSFLSSSVMNESFMTPRPSDQDAFAGALPGRAGAWNLSTGDHLRLFRATSHSDGQIITRHFTRTSVRLPSATRRPQPGQTAVPMAHRTEMVSPAELRDALICTEVAA